MPDKKTFYPLSDVESILPILNKIAIFGGLSDMQLYRMFQLLERVYYSAGEFVYKRGEEPSYIYIIRSGEIKIVLGSDDSSLELASYGVGDCFGETAVIGMQPHGASALAVVDTELIVLEHRALLTAYETDKDLFGMLVLNIARETSRRLHQMDEILLQSVLKGKGKKG